MLKIEGVKFRRDNFSLTADFSLAEGTRAAITGPSGGGKSTLLSLIAGFDQPDEGRILSAGSDLAGVLPGKRPVAVLFQDNNLFPHLDLLTNVALGASPHAKPRQAALEQALDALSRVGLLGFEARKPGVLSGGQQSRAALARILLTKRPVVLMDEPFSALGPSLRAEMLDLVIRLLPEATLLMVTHDPEDAKRFASQVLFVNDGTVSPPKDTAEFFEHPEGDVAEYLS
ncbi:MAG: ATP-binding cassette domain-containing protein [Boseongicola sp.]